jgi:hypothetical protein
MALRLLNFARAVMPKSFAEARPLAGGASCHVTRHPKRSRGAPNQEQLWQRWWFRNPSRSTVPRWLSSHAQ